jgi:hypothetical protein
MVAGNTPLIVNESSPAKRFEEIVETSLARCWLTIRLLRATLMIPLVQSR